jgi:hypothetical protein
MLLLGGSHYGAAGPGHQVTAAGIEAAFAAGWRIDSIERAMVDTTAEPDGLPGWLAALSLPAPATRDTAAVPPRLPI